MWRILIQVATVLVCGLGVFAGLRGSPYLEELPFVPESLGRWLDGHGNTRHFFGYIILTVMTGWAFLGEKTLKVWLRLMLLMTTLAILLEAAQLFRPNRHADIHDLAWAWLGSALGSALGWGAWGRRRQGRSAKGGDQGDR